MIENLLIGFPFDRPGGLLLSVIYFVVAGGLALMLGILYSYICISFRSLGILLQIVGVLIRGVPLLLLAFLCAHIPYLSIGFAGLLALTIYSYTHVGEILRGFLNSYPQYLKEQSMVMGLNQHTEWLFIRIPWVISKSLPALLTHWVSLLKDSGALLVISLGELATVAKSMSELSKDFSDWAGVLLVTAAFYLVTTLVIIRVVNYFGTRFTFNGINRGDRKVNIYT